MSILCATCKKKLTKKEVSSFVPGFPFAKCARCTVEDELRNNLISVRAEVARLRESLRNATNANCTCGGSGPGESDCVACAIYHSVYGYYVKDHGETIEDARNKDIDDDDDIEYAISELCDWAWFSHDGWEWLRDGTTLSVVRDGVEMGDYYIKVESQPVFTAERLEIKS